MDDFKQVKKVCSFYVSRTHFITMILPYINQQIENENIVENFLEYNFEPSVNEILNKIILKNEKKNRILNINWKSIKFLRASVIEKTIKRHVKDNKNINIIINGSNKYIEEVNIIISKYLHKNNIHVKINVINCYEVDFFNNNIREILDKHEYILNTSGLNRIEDVFEGYGKKGKKGG